MLFRPDFLLSGSMRLFSGSFLVISSKVLTLIERRPGEVGLYLRTAMLLLLSSPLNLLEEIDVITRNERHNRFLPARLLTRNPSAAAARHARLRLRFHIQRVDRLHFDIEGLLNCRPNLNLVSFAGDSERVLASLHQPGIL